MCIWVLVGVYLYPSLQELGTDNKLSTGLTVDRNKHCWSVMGNRSLDVCGVQGE